MDLNATDSLSVLRERKSLAGMLAWCAWIVACCTIAWSPTLHGPAPAAVAVAVGLSAWWIARAVALRRFLDQAGARFRNNARSSGGHQHGADAPSEFASMDEAREHGWTFTGELGRYRGGAIPAAAVLDGRSWRFAGLRKGHGEQLMDNAVAFGDLVFAAG